MKTEEEVRPQLLGLQEEGVIKELDVKAFDDSLGEKAGEPTSRPGTEVDTVHDATQCALDEHDSSNGERGLNEDAVPSEDCVTDIERSSARGFVKRFIDATRNFQQEA